MLRFCQDLNIFSYCLSPDKVCTIRDALLVICLETIFSGKLEDFVLM